MERKETILIVEDDKAFAEAVAIKLKRSFNVLKALSIEEARSVMQSGVIHGILLDVRLDENSAEKDGLVLLTEIKKERSMLPVVVMTSFGDVVTAVEAMKLGADEFVEKLKVQPVDLVNILKEVIQKSRSQLQIAARAAEQQMLETSKLVGNASALQPVVKSISLAANDGYCSVLITGQTGTGKEVIARSIHEQGWRKDGPFVGFSISGLNETLVESELFGYEQGAFTGANKPHTGYIEKANGGVLFLDEIGDLSPNVQLKLLRFLEDRIVYRVGSTKGRPVDVQLVFATNVDLKEGIASGNFREDFFYRIKTVEIKSPALCDREGDIPLLADHFLHQLRMQGRTKLAGFSPKAISALETYAYPGNVRELKAVIEWSVLVAQQSNHWIVEYEDIPIEVRESKMSKPLEPFNITLGDDLNVDRACAIAELACVDRALDLSKGNKSETEVMLGYSGRHTMRRRIQKIKEAHADLWISFPHVVQAYDNNV